MTPSQARIEVLELMPLEMVEAVADYFASLASETVRGAADADPESRACAEGYWQECLRMAGNLRSAVRKYEEAVLEHLNSDCKGH